MNSLLIQHWHVAYLCTALLFAAVALIAGDHLRAADPPAMSIRCNVALTAGALWPVMVVGMVQLWAINRLAGRRRRTAVSPAEKSAPRLAGAGSH